eukprot:3538363-Rhodomonas_salina.1
MYLAAASPKITTAMTSPTLLAKTNPKRDTRMNIVARLSSECLDISSSPPKAANMLRGEESSARPIAGQNTASNRIPNQEKKDPKCVT